MNWQDKIELPNDKDYNKFLDNIMKKKPYTLKIEDNLIVNIKKRADKNNTSVSHEIRQAIRKYLGL